MDWRRGLLVAVAAGFTLTGCVTPRQTPYQSMGFLGGVSATQIDADTMQILAKGNGYTPLFTLVDYVRLKAADETIARGYDVFEITNSDDASRVETVPLGLYVSTPVTKHDVTVQVKMFKGPKPKDAGDNYFDAREVEQTLGVRIKRN